MSTASVPNTFTTGTTAQAGQVNQNFTNLVAYINANCIVADGTTSLSALLAGPNADPTSINHLTRKKYVDDRVGRQAAISSTSTLNMGATLNPTFLTAHTVTITNPGKDVTVAAWGSGDALCGGTATRWDVRLSISFDNGATYTAQPQQINNIAAAQFSSFTCLGLKTGTPTGDIKIKLEASQYAANGALHEPTIMYDMFKAVTV